MKYLPIYDNIILILLQKTQVTYNVLSSFLLISQVNLRTPTEAILDDFASESYKKALRPSLQVL